jgi:hypothetical protein
MAAPIVGSDPGSAWCGAAHAVDDAGLGFDAVDFTDPAAVEAAIDELVSSYDEASRVAPAEIRDDVATSFDGLRELRAQLAAVGYDFLDADLSVLEDSDGSIGAANARIERYNLDVCGIVPSGSDQAAGPGGFDPAAGTIRDQTIAQLVAAGFTQDEAGCIFDHLDFTDPTLGSDMTVIAGVFDTCGIDLARLGEIGG